MYIASRSKVSRRDQRQSIFHSRRGSYTAVLDGGGGGVLLLCIYVHSLVVVLYFFSCSNRVRPFFYTPRVSPPPLRVVSCLSCVWHDVAWSGLAGRRKQPKQRSSLLCWTSRLLTRRYGKGKGVRSLYLRQTWRLPPLRLMLNGNVAAAVNNVLCC